VGLAVIASLRDDLPQWRRIRTLAAPHGMIAAATAAREAGDWRAAAAAARVDVDVDLADIRERFGAEATAALEDDLQHLALDLLWWHLPRHQGGLTTVMARQNAVLYPERDARQGPLIRVQTPIAPFGPQRLTLTIESAEDLEDERWFAVPRYAWDVRRAGELAEAWGVGDPVSDKVYRLLAAGEFDMAWALCGIDVESTETLQPRPTRPTCPIGVAREVRDVAKAFGTDRVGTIGNASLMFGVHDQIEVAEAEHYDIYEVPGVLARGVPADLALLEAGLLAVEDLHPLVRAVLPDMPVPSSPAPSAYEEKVRVRCRGEWHVLSVDQGALRLHAHTDEEVQREAVVRSLGGASAGCFAVRQTWLSGAGRLPKALARHRTAVRERAFAGDTDWLIKGLTAGTIDPRMRDSSGWSLLHMAMMVDYERLLPLLDAAGLPVDVPDNTGRTPLYIAIMGGASRELIQTLLDRGADPYLETEHGADSFTAAWRGHDWVHDLLKAARPTASA